MYVANVENGWSAGNEKKKLYLKISEYIQITRQQTKKDIYNQNAFITFTSDLNFDSY